MFGRATIAPFSLFSRLPLLGSNTHGRQIILGGSCLDNCGEMGKRGGGDVREAAIRRKWLMERHLA